MTSFYLLKVKNNCRTCWKTWVTKEQQMEWRWTRGKKNNVPWYSKKQTKAKTNDKHRNWWHIIGRNRRVQVLRKIDYTWQRFIQGNFGEGLKSTAISWKEKNTDMFLKRKITVWTYYHQWPSVLKHGLLLNIKRGSWQ